MPELSIVLAILFMAAIVLAVGYACWRMGWIGRTDRKVSSGLATWLQDMNNMLQPQQPRAEEIRQAEEGEHEDEDVGDGRSPERPR